MSAVEIIDYVSFRFALRDLHGRADEKDFIDVNSHISYFEKVESDIIALRVYSELAGMEETERVLKTAATGKRRDGTFAGGDRKKFTSEIYSDLPAILRKADMLAVTKMPPRNPAMKGRIVDLIRRLYDLKENMPEIPEGKYVNLNSTELFLGAHWTVYSALAGILSEVKSVDPLARVEDHYRDAYRYLNPDDGYNETGKKLENMMPAMASIEALFGVLKTYHEISDSEIALPKEVLQLKKQLDAAYERVVELGEQLEQMAQAQQPVRILPKHEDALVELGGLQKKLMENIGSNSLSIDFKPIVNRSVILLTKIILSGLDDDGLPAHEQELLHESWDMPTVLKDIKGDKQLDETRKELMKEYSFHIEEFLKGK